MRERKLYIEYRVHFNPNTNQDLLREMATVVQERLHDMFLGSSDVEFEQPMPCDVTFEIVMEVGEELVEK